MALDIDIGADAQPDTGFAIVIGTTPVSGTLNIDIGADPQPDTGFDIVIGTSPGVLSMDIVIGADPQPDTGFAIVIGTSPTSAVLLDVAIPHGVAAGATLVACVVRTGAVYPSDPTGWRLERQGLGAGSKLLDVWVRVADGSEGGTTFSVLSFTPQEMQGTLLLIPEAAPTVILADATLPITATASLSTPQVQATKPLDSVLCMWCVDGSTSVAAPAELTQLDTYSSAVVSSRTFQAAFVRAGDAPVTLGPASAGAPVSGQAWSLVVSFQAAAPGPEPGVRFLDEADLLGVLDRVLPEWYLDPLKVGS